MLLYLGLEGRAWAEEFIRLKVEEQNLLHCRRKGV